MIVFIITSALNTNFSIIDYQTRFNQLITSALSVRKKVPSAYIIMADGGLNPITFLQRQILLQYYNEIFDLSQHSFIQSIQTIPNITAKFVKSPCEAYMMKHICETIGSNHIQRLFKLSGRYQLTKFFDLNMHINQKNKYVFKKLDSGTLFYDASSGISFDYVPYQYQTRLYSICGSILDEAAINFELIKNVLINIYHNNSFLAIENATYQILPKDQIVELDKIGVKGLGAENKDIINE